MARKKITRFTQGRHGIEKIIKREKRFSAGHTLPLTPGQKENLKNIMDRYTGGGGITTGGPASVSELGEVYHDLLKSGSFSRTEARGIRRELRKYGKDLQSHPELGRASRALVNAEYLKGLRDTEPRGSSILYGGSNRFDPHKPSPVSESDHDGSSASSGQEYLDRLTGNTSSPLPDRGSSPQGGSSPSGASSDSGGGHPSSVDR